MQWQAANVTKPKPSEEERRKASQTLEAALNKLSKAYGTAMECVGALHRKQPANLTQEQYNDNMKTIAIAARKAFEVGVLVDPLISPHTPAIARLMDSYATNQEHSCSSERWQFYYHRNKIAPSISSPAQKATVRKLAYLALVNYADLLLAATPRIQINATTYIIEQGIVDPLSIFQEQSAWEDDSDIDRIALWAYSDASQLDDTDPVLWIKIACAARRWTRRQQPHMAAIGLPGRPLEAHALFRASKALPPTMPPNRMVQRALREFLREEHLPNGMYPDKVANPIPHAKSYILHLNRNSWSALGRLILRAAREGLPRVTLHLPPLLTLDTKTLRHVVSFLTDTNALESTCRAMATIILVMRIEKTSRQRAPNHPVPSLPPMQEQQQPQDAGESSTTRTSKRIQSQQISEEKRTERRARRHSLEYCLTAAVTGMTRYDALYRARLEMPSEDTVPESKSMGALSTGTKPTQVSWHTVPMSTTIADWKATSSWDLILSFMSHVALNTSTVYMSDTSGTLTSCLIECKYCVGEEKLMGFFMFP